MQRLRRGKHKAGNRTLIIPHHDAGRSVDQAIHLTTPPPSKLINRSINKLYDDTWGEPAGQIGVLQPSYNTGVLFDIAGFTATM